MNGSLANERLLFVMELEFVQCLANPAYLHFLSQRGLMGDPRFVAYLEYLQYWHRPEYATHIQYPNGLKTLRKLLDGVFRRRLADPEFISQIHRQQYDAWLASGVSESLI